MALYCPILSCTVPYCPVLSCTVPYPFLLVSLATATAIVAAIVAFKDWNNFHMQDKDKFKWKPDEPVGNTTTIFVWVVV